MAYSALYNRLRTRMSPLPNAMMALYMRMMFPSNKRADRMGPTMSALFPRKSAMNRVRAFFRIIFIDNIRQRKPPLRTHITRQVGYLDRQRTSVQQGGIGYLQPGERVDVGRETGGAVSFGRIDRRRQSAWEYPSQPGWEFRSGRGVEDGSGVADGVSVGCANNSIRTAGGKRQGNIAM